MSHYRDDRAAWLQLEELRTHKPSAEGTCLKCAQPSSGATLCGSCESLRLEGMRRFGGRAGTNNPRRRFASTQPYRFPYAEDNA